VRTFSAQGMLRRQLVGLAAGIVVFTLAAGAAHVSAAQASARSTDVTLVNRTGCVLFRADYGVQHGEWWDFPNHIPPDYMAPGQQATWITESNGFMTGDEGWVRFTTFCGNGGPDYRSIQVHWDNPYYGANSYDYDGTDPAFFVPHTGGGGDNALVTFFASRID
jgi:hypothetical protein